MFGLHQHAQSNSGGPAVSHLSNYSLLELLSLDQLERKTFKYINDVPEEEDDRYVRIQR